MKSAYYSRAESYSRSFNAELAEKRGCLPLTRAAASLRLTSAAFRAGVLAYNLSPSVCAIDGPRREPSEWHHVGKYASEVDYYDCGALMESDEFRAAALAAMSKRKKTMVEAAWSAKAYCRQCRRLFYSWKELAAKIATNLRWRNPKTGRKPLDKPMRPDSHERAASLGMKCGTPEWSQWNQSASLTGKWNSPADKEYMRAIARFHRGARHRRIWAHWCVVCTDCPA